MLMIITSKFVKDYAIKRFEVVFYDKSQVHAGIKIFVILGR